jgi:hypothetical protein
LQMMSKFGTDPKPYLVETVAFLRPDEASCG